MKISEAKLLPGDCILTQGDSFISKGIMFFTSWHTKKAVFSHVACYIGNGRCIEALTKSKITKLKRYDGKNKKLKVYRLMLTNEQREEFVNGAFDIANRAYGWTKIPLFAMDGILTKAFSLFGRKTPIFFFSKYFGIFSIPVCSQLYAYILYKYCHYSLYDINFKEVSWRIVQPDYLDDLLNFEINKAEVVYKQKVK